MARLKPWSPTQYSNLALSILLLLQQFSPIFIISIAAQDIDTADETNLAQTEEERCLSPKAQTSCGECIRSGRLCTWMEKGVYNNTRTKCFSKGDGRKPPGSVYPVGVSLRELSNTGKLNTYIKKEFYKKSILVLEENQEAPKQVDIQHVTKIPSSLNLAEIMEYLQPEELIRTLCASKLGQHNDRRSLTIPTDPCCTRRQRQRQRKDSGIAQRQQQRQHRQQRQQHD